MPNAKSHRSKRSHASSGSTRRKSRKREGGEEQGSLRPFWSGTLSFGLVSVPVDLYPATRSAHVGLRMLAPDGTPIARRYYCPEHDTEISSDDMVRGYEHKPGKFVEVTDEELESLEPRKSRDIDLQKFVPADAIDAMYFDRSFFLLPSGDSSKAYHLLAAVMEQTQRAGIATFVLRDREYLAAIFASKGLLTAEALRFHDEVRDIEPPGVSRKTKVSAADVKHYAALIAKHAHDRFDPELLHDEHGEALRELAEKKAKQHRDVIESDAGGADDDSSEAAETVDLMKLLKKSLRA